MTVACLSFGKMGRSDSRFGGSGPERGLIARKSGSVNGFCYRSPVGSEGPTPRRGGVQTPARTRIAAFVLRRFASLRLGRSGFVPLQTMRGGAT